MHAGLVYQRRAQAEMASTRQDQPEIEIENDALGILAACRFQGEIRAGSVFERNEARAHGRRHRDEEGFPAVSRISDQA